MSFELEYSAFRGWLEKTTPVLKMDEYYSVCCYGRKEFRQLDFTNRTRAIEFACGLKFAEVYVWIEVKTDVVQFSRPDVLDG